MKFLAIVGFGALLCAMTVSAAPSENPFDDSSSSETSSDESSFFGDNEQVGFAAVKEYIECYLGAVGAGLKNTTFEQQWTTEALPQCQETLVELGNCEHNDEPEACFAEKVFELIAQLTDTLINAPLPDEVSDNIDKHIEECNAKYSSPNSFSALSAAVGMMVKEWAESSSPSASSEEE